VQSLPIPQVAKELDRTDCAFQTFLSVQPAFEEKGGVSRETIALSAITEWCRKSGVTRLAESTHLDRLFIPNFYAVRPAALHPSAIVSSGKGVSGIAAKLSALFECYERWAAEEVKGPIFTATQKRIINHFPDAIFVFRGELDPTLVREWTIAFELISRKPCFVLIDQAVFPPRFETSFSGNFLGDTNGLASGTNATEAICSGILELIERDAVRRVDSSALTRLRPDSFPEQPKILADIYAKNNIELSFISCPSPTAVPTFYCISRDRRFESTHFFCSGSAAHPDFSIAMTRTLTEVSQSRVGFISSLREDVSATIETSLTFSFSERLEERAYWFESPFAEIDFHPNPNYILNGASLLHHLIGRVQSSFPSPSLACVQLRAFPGLHAFRLICPQMHGLSRRV
jgi:ribosomal protein S12 methylthiotransferase accessory factor